MSRFSYIHQGRVIYEWEQNLTSVNIYIPTPPLPQTIKKSQIFNVDIKPNSIQVGLKGNPPYLHHKLQGIVDTDECVWYIQNKQQKIAKNTQKKSEMNQSKQQLVIELQKGQKGVQWGCVFEGHKKLNPLEQQQLKKKLMLERFGQQNPGFDFSNAQFNGNVPLAREFMGGVKYS